MKQCHNIYKWWATRGGPYGGKLEHSRLSLMKLYIPLYKATISYALSEEDKE